MRKSHWNLCILLSAILGITISGNAAEISWSAAFEIETDEDVDVSKDIVRAVNVADPDAVEEFEIEFPGGIVVEFESEHTFEFNADLDEEFASGGHVTGDGTFYTGEGLTTDNDDLDRVLNSHGWSGGGPGATVAVLELTELTKGTDYQIQLIGAADDRGCCEFRQMQLVDEELEPINSADGDELWFGRSNDFDQDDERGPGSVIGTFTADDTTQLIRLMGTADFDDGSEFEELGNGNDPGLSAYILSTGGGGGLLGDFDNSGVLDLADIDMLTAESASGANNAGFDVTDDGNVNTDDVQKWVKDLANSWIGDANLDGEFGSGDFVQVFQGGKFETGQAATWSQGDWDGDGVFSSGDFVVAFQDGGFEKGQRAAAGVPEPSSIVLALLGAVALLRRRR